MSLSPAVGSAESTWTSNGVFTPIWVSVMTADLVISKDTFLVTVPNKKPLAVKFAWLITEPSEIKLKTPLVA